MNLYSSNILKQQSIITLIDRDYGTKKEQVLEKTTAEQSI